MIPLFLLFSKSKTVKMNYPEGYSTITIPVYYDPQYTKHPIWNLTLSYPPPPENFLPIMSYFAQQLPQETIEPSMLELETVEPSMLELDNLFGFQEEETQVSIIFTSFYFFTNFFRLNLQTKIKGELRRETKGKLAREKQGLFKNMFLLRRC